MEWRKWLEQKPIWEADQLAQWIGLNPIRRGHIGTAVELAVGNAAADKIERLTRFERARRPSAAVTGRVYYATTTRAGDDTDEWTAAALALCWRYTYAPRFVDATDAVDAIIERRPIVVAGASEDWRTMLLEAPLLLLRDTGRRESAPHRDALTSLLSRRMIDGRTTIVTFRSARDFAELAPHWTHGGNELTAVALPLKGGT